MSKLQKGEEIRKCSQQGRGRERGQRSEVGKGNASDKKNEGGKEVEMWKGRVVEFRGERNINRHFKNLFVQKLDVRVGAEKKESNFNIYNWNDAMNVKWVLDLGALIGVNPTTKQPPNDEKLT
jgi:hypothetical protein